MERCASACSKKNRHCTLKFWPHISKLIIREHETLVIDWSLFTKIYESTQKSKMYWGCIFPFQYFSMGGPGVRFFLTKSSASNVAETRVEFGLTNPVICLDLPKVGGKSSKNLLPSGGERWWWFTMVEIRKISPQKKKSMKHQILIGWVVVWLLKGSLMTKCKWTNLSEVAGPNKFPQQKTQWNICILYPPWN